MFFREVSVKFSILNLVALYKIKLFLDKVTQTHDQRFNAFFANADAQYNAIDRFYAQICVLYEDFSAYETVFECIYATKIPQIRGNSCHDIVFSTPLHKILNDHYTTHTIYLQDVQVFFSSIYNLQRIH